MIPRNKTFPLHIALVLLIISLTLFFMFAPNTEWLSGLDTYAGSLYLGVLQPEITICNSFIPLCLGVSSGTVITLLGIEIGLILVLVGLLSLKLWRNGK